jgi:hypothetical protein
MKNGFDFFRTRNDSILPKIGLLEQDCGIKLPPMYKLFMETFDVGPETCHFRILNSRLCAPEFDYIKSAEMGGDKIGILIGNFHSIEEAFQYWQSGMSTDTWIPCQIFDIAYGWSGSLRIYVGIGPDNWDEIWIDDWDRTIVNGPTKIADNIFEFLKKFKEEDLSDKYVGDKLNCVYRKWGDGNFWRLSPVQLEEE